MREKMEAQYEANTFSLVPPTPDMDILECSWVFRVKHKVDGTLDKLRTRLVAKGFHQEEGVDFTEKYSHVVRLATIQIVLVVATTKDVNYATGCQKCFVTWRFTRKCVYDSTAWI